MAIGIGVHIGLYYFRSRLIGIAYIITQAGVVQVCILLYGWDKIHLIGVAKGIECLLLLICFQVTLCQVVICILCYLILSVDNPIELTYSLLVLLLLIVGKA